MNGMCVQVVDPCASKTDCGSSPECHLMGGGCMSNNSPCHGQQDCLSCIWDAGVCKSNNEICSSATTEATCLSCHKPGTMCMSKSDPCNGMTCINMAGCTLDNGVCKQVTDPCMSAKYCGDCSWNSNFGGSCQVKPQSLSSCSGNNELHCRDCEMSNNKCSSKKDPCTGMEHHCAMMSPVGMCKMENSICVLAADPCESSGHCGSCSWESSTRVCVTTDSHVTDSCSLNKKEGTCLSCHQMSGICMSNTDSCNGMESHCSSMANCEMKNGRCTMISDPCEASTYCGGCTWKEGKCEKSTGHTTTAHVDHSQHFSKSGQMVMTFFDSHDVVLLWKEIDITSKGHYTLAILIVFFLSMFVMLLKDYVSHHNDHHLAIRMVLMLVAITLSNLVMLIVMIMNVGLFISVMFGSTIGFGIVEYKKIREKRRIGEKDVECGSKAQTQPAEADGHTECHYP